MAVQAALSFISEPTFRLELLSKSSVGLKPLSTNSCLSVLCYIVYYFLVSLLKAAKAAETITLICSELKEQVDVTW